MNLAEKAGIVTVDGTYGCGCPWKLNGPPQCPVHTPRTDNVLKIGPLELEASGDYLILLRDEFRSGYECVTCNGIGSWRCLNCMGSGKSMVSKDARCSACEGRGTVLCEHCKGKGVVEGGLVIPEDRQNEPTTGTIVSCGPDVKRYANGQAIMFPSYAGHQLKLGGETPEGEEKEYLVVIMHESEAICKVRGHLELRRLKKKLAAHTTA
jgi:co-chaperonin GroES (HSP10)